MNAFERNTFDEGNVKHIAITRKELCCGCSACANACPKKCIDMQFDDEGFLYPVVDSTKCIECGLCTKVCPVHNSSHLNDKIPLSYVVQNKNSLVRKESSSGGMFSVLAEYVLAKQGIVFGAAYDDNFVVKHIGIESVSDLYKLRGSKYVQSEVGVTFRKAKECLENGRWVCYSGTPCQIAGLKNFLKKNYEKLLLVDIVCHGTPSPILFKKYVEYHTRTDGSLKNIYFRNKEFGYAGSTMALEFKSGKKRFTGQDVHFFKESFFRDLSTRPSCYQCRFKTINRVSDFTLFDCWCVNTFKKEMDDDKGTTSVLIHSQKGLKIFDELSDKIEGAQVDFDLLKKDSGSMIEGRIKMNPLRDEFFKDAVNFTIPEMVKKYTPLTVKKRCIQTIKPILNRFNVLHVIKRRVGKLL